MFYLRIAFAFLLASAPSAFAQPAAKYQYMRLGNVADAVTSPQPGYALMGGGTDLDEAFRWMCGRAHGGDFLVIRARGDDAYNAYIQPLCKVNSVATLIIPSREAANDPFVATTIAHAETIFIAGGDQANYIRFWKDTPVETALNEAIRKGVPLGGTSAGLAVMGEWAYTAEGDKPDDPNLDAKVALADPLGPRVTLVRGFLEIPILKAVITDSHFVKRERMGRLLAFLARIQFSNPDEKIRGIGIDERTALLLETDGHGVVVGHGVIDLVEPNLPQPMLRPGKPLAAGDFTVQTVRAPGSLDIVKWCCGEPYYTITIEDGQLRPGRTQ